MRDAVLEELVAVDGEAVSAVHLDQVGLGVDRASVPTDIGQRGLEQTGGVTMAARSLFGAHPPDPEQLVTTGIFLDQAQCRDDLARGFLEPEMPGLGCQVTAIKFRVWAGLLDNENRDAQLQQFIESRRIEILSPATAQRTRHIAPSLAHRLTRSVRTVRLGYPG